MNKHAKFFVFSFLILIIFPSYSYAQEVAIHTDSCVSLFETKELHTGQDFADRAIETIKNIFKSTPQPNNIKPLGIFRIGVIIQKAFRALMPKDANLRENPGMNAENHLLAHRKAWDQTEGRLGSLRITVPNTSNNPELQARYPITHTDLVFQIPGDNIQPNSEYLINDAFKVVYLQIHGVGTSTSDAQTISGIADYLVKVKQSPIPVIGVTLPGHGDATDIEFDNMDEYFNWLLAIIKKYVHPNVKVVLGGHSGGAMIALMMHKYSNDPRFAQIAGYVSLSPGIDVAPGKDMEAKMKEAYRIKEKLDRVIHGIDQDVDSILARVSMKDLEFLGGMIANVKFSPLAVAGFLPIHMEYDMTVPRKEIREQLKPACVMFGVNDGLCIVGRERHLGYFARVFGALRSFIFGKGVTHEGNQTMTGHQTMDNKLKLADGTLVPEVYYRLWQFITQDLNLQNQSIPTAEKTSTELAQGTIKKVWFLLQNNWAAREYFKNARSYLESESKYYKDTLPTLKILDKALGEYQDKLRQLKTVSEQRRIQYIKSYFQKEGLRRVSIYPEYAKMPYELFESAKKEISLVRSPQREAELKDFLSKVTQEIHARVDGKIDRENTEAFEKIKDSFFQKAENKRFDFNGTLNEFIQDKDPKKPKVDLLELTQGNPKANAIVKKYLNNKTFEELMDSFYLAWAVSRESLDSKESFVQTTLFFEPYKDLAQKGPDQEKEALDKSINDAKSMYDAFLELKGLKNLFGPKFGRYISNLETMVSEKYKIRTSQINNRNNMINSILDKYSHLLPSGITLKATDPEKQEKKAYEDPRQYVEWELRSYQYTDAEFAQRQKTLRNIVATFEKDIKRFDDAEKEKVDMVMETFVWPSSLGGVKVRNYNQAKALQAQLMRIKDGTPPLDASEELHNIDKEIKSLTEQSSQVALMLSDKKLAYVNLKERATKISKTLKETMDLDFNSIKKSNVEFTYPQTLAKQEQFWKLHEEIIRTDHLLQEEMIKAKLYKYKNKPVPQQVLAEIERLQNHFLKLKDSFIVLKSETIKLRIYALLRGEFKINRLPTKIKLDGKPVEQFAQEQIPKKLAELIGSPENLLAEQFDKNSLEYGVFSAREVFNKTLQTSIEIDKRLNALKLKRSLLMKLNHPNYQHLTVNEIKWNEVFDKLTFEQLVDWLTSAPERREALEKVVSDFESLWTTYLAEDHLRLPWYRLERDGNGQPVVQIP